MYLQEHEHAQVVMMFDQKGSKIVKELLYPEFETLLDNYLPSPEWAGEDVRSVYVEVDNHFHVKAAVFFLLNFTKDGMVEASWNMPLEDLGRTSNQGPDLGGGPIRLACASRCPVAYYKEWLWDPNMKAQGTNHFAAIKKAVKHNSLGILFHVDEDAEETQADKKTQLDLQKLEEKLSSKLSKQYQSELRDHMAQFIKDQRLRTATMASEQAQSIKEVRLEYAKKIEALTKQLDHANHQLKDAETRNEELKQTINGQVQKIEGLREYFEHKLKQTDQGDAGELEALLVKERDAEYEAKLAVATQELNDLLKMKEVELQYRADHEAELREELKFLREENQELLQNSGDHVLEKLSRKGVNFVTYQPGAGHITIPLSEVSTFIESPIGFTAAALNVSETHYEAWLQHFQAPVCKAVDEQGEMCCENLDRIVSPVDFVMGESDFCDKHNRLKIDEEAC